MTEDNPLIKIAMQVILYAGDARNSCNEAVELARRYEFDKAEQKLDEAKEFITKAHRYQTEVIQKEMSGTDYGYSLLFIHAQDTLMTINTEVRMTSELIEVYKVLKKLGG